MRRSTFLVSGIFAGSLILSLTPASRGQWDDWRKRRLIAPCFIRPDPQASSALGIGGLGRCGSVAPVPAPVPVVASPFGARSLGFGTMIPGGTFANRICGPRSVVVSAPYYCQDVLYPSTNLGACTAGSFYQPRDVNVLTAQAPLVAQPSSVFINNTTYVSTPNYGTRTPPGSGDHAISDALAAFKAQKQAARAASVNVASPPPPPNRSEDELRRIDVMLDRGDQQFKVGNYYAAREEYTRALVLAGEDSGVRIAFGMSEMALGHYADASRAFRQAVSTEPTLDPASIDISQAYARPADFETDLRNVEAALARNPFDADALFVLGFLKACSGNPIGGRAVFDRYTALRSADPAVRPFIQRVSEAH